MRLNFAGGSYPSVPISAQESVNCFVEYGQEATNQIVIKGVPGTSLFADLTDPIRGMKESFESLYVVAGSTAYRIDSSGTTTNLGTVSDDDLPVSITQNIFETLIVSGGNGYVVQEGASSLTAVSDVDFPSTLIADSIDDFGLLVEKNSGRFYWTDLSDFESVNGANFATAEGSPDDLVSLLVDHREIWLFGKKTTEVWYNDGTPFVRVPGGFLQKGCGATHSPKGLDNTVYWLGNDGVVYKAEGLVPIRVSNHGIEQLIASTTQSNGIGYSYTQDGHAFYGLNFPGQATIVYDASTQLWHTRETEGRDDCVYHHHAKAYGNHYVGGVDGKVYKLDPDLYTHNGNDLIRTRTIGPIRTDGFTTMPKLEFVMETGGGSYSEDSQLMLRISDDGGETFSGPMFASMGRKGQRMFNVRFDGLGGFYDNERVLKVSLSDDAPFVIVDVMV